MSQPHIDSRRFSPLSPDGVLPPMPPSMGFGAVRSHARFQTHAELMALWNRAQAHGELFNVTIDRPFFARPAFPLEEVVVWTLDSAGQKVVQTRTIASGQGSSWLGFWRFSGHDHCWLMSQRESMRMRAATQDEIDGFEGTSLATPRPHAGFADSYATLRDADDLVSDFERDRTAVDAFEAMASAFRAAGAPSPRGMKGRPFFSTSPVFTIPELWRPATLLRESIYFHGARGSVTHALPGSILMATPGVDAANGLDWIFEIINPFEFHAGWVSDDAQLAAVAVNEFTHSAPEPLIFHPVKHAPGMEPLAAPNMNLPSLAAVRGEGMIFGNREDANAGAYEHATVVDEAQFDALPFDEAMARDASHPGQSAQRAPSAFAQRPAEEESSLARNSSVGFSPRPSAPRWISPASTAQQTPTRAEPAGPLSPTASSAASAQPFWKRPPLPPQSAAGLSTPPPSPKSFAEAYGRKSEPAISAPSVAKTTATKDAEPQGFFARVMAAKALARPNQSPEPARSTQPASNADQGAAHATAMKASAEDVDSKRPATDAPAPQAWQPAWSRSN